MNGYEPSMFLAKVLMTVVCCAAILGTVAFTVSSFKYHSEDELFQAAIAVFAIGACAIEVIACAAIWLLK